MITLTDVRHDLRIRKEAESATQAHEVIVVSNMESVVENEQTFRGFTIRNVRLRTRWLPKSPVFWIIKYGEFTLRAARAAARCRADLYHGHEITGAVPALLAARWRGAKFVYDAHELEADRTGHVEKSWWLKRLVMFCLRRVLRRADHVICASESRADIMLAEYGVRERPTAILNVTPRAGLPSMVDPAQVLADHDLAGKRIVLYQGAIMPGRGLDHATAALKFLPQDVVFVVLGGGDPAALVAQAERDGTRDRLILVGRVPPDELTAYMRRADVGLAIYRNTCRNNYYCAPNKVYEYASEGLPIVGPNFPDVQALVETTGIGATFDPEDPSSIAAAIRTVLDAPERRAAMSAAARRLNETVNWEQQAGRLRNIYDNLLAP